MAERRRVFGVYVAKGQRLLLRGNAVVECAVLFTGVLDANRSRGHVGKGWACDVGHTMCPKEHAGEHDMHYLSDVVDRRPMLRVAGQIVLAFSCAAPLVLLLCFLI